ncbi:hypothetical protein L1987_52931 [Smallanthus sonchifolius]|uniref:Uncharacterized protein n=1 Tax=Smallanthus sonchifolius TaxID=185202 RepID=A0ACB9EUX9_9ASTR|nr:hypothetical protein L1987_52931 [Smallanthus sonchifolius]
MPRLPHPDILIHEVRILRSQRTGTEERLKNVLAQNELLIKTNEMLLGHGSSLELRFDSQRKEHELMVKLIADLTKKLDAQGEKDKEKEKEKKTTGDEACHPVDLTKDDDKDKDPEAGPSGGEHQALAIVPISAVPMAQGKSTHQEGGDTSGGGGGGDKRNSVAEVLKDLSDDEILYLEPDYSKEAQIDALFNLEEGEIDSGDDWDDDDEDVVIEIPKGDGEGEYELEDGEIFEFPSFDAPLDTGSIEQASNVEALTEASPVNPAPVDPEAPKDTDMPSTSSKGPAPVWQKTSITDKHGATGMILAVSEAFSSLPKYDLVNLANRELLGHSNHAVAMGLWVVLQREARSGKFEMFKPQVPKRVKDKHAVHPVTKKHLKKLVYKPVRCETKIPLSKLSQDILGDMWYWYVDPKTGEAVIMGKGRSESGNMVPKELIRIFDEVCFINFSVKDLEVLAERYCVYTYEWTKLLASKYEKVIKFCLDYKKKMEAKDQALETMDPCYEGCSFNIPSMCENANTLGGGKQGRHNNYRNKHKVYWKQEIREVSLDPANPDIKVLVGSNIPKDIETKLINFLKERRSTFTWKHEDMTDGLQNVVVIQKKNGKWRVCVDFTDLNNACPKDPFPLPHIDSMIDATTGHEMLTFMDASSGFQQIQMEPSDQEDTVFMTPTYKLGDTMEVYIDDMVVKSKKAEDHLKDLKEAFDILDKYNMKFNPSKCHFGIEAGKFLGYMKNNRFEWSEKHDEAFQALKKYLALAPLLMKPEDNEPLFLYLAISKSALKYEALIEGLRLAIDLKIMYLQVYVDSLIITNHFNGSYVAKRERLIRYLEIVKDLRGEFEIFQITQVPREDNTEPDALANLGSGLKIPLNSNIPIIHVMSPAIDPIEDK